MSPNAMKAFAAFLSWAIMFTLIAIVIGGIVLIFEAAVTVQIGFVSTGFAEWFLGMFSLSIGLGLLAIGMIVTMSFLLATTIAILIKNGQQFILNLITKIEE
ncbi:MAG: hypothetical protein HWN67_19245 [Candidatus Helarchaeota archaeon]|nr:hypothetical protein [Candidatus Helarchaeota archaeon]